MSFWIWYTSLCGPFYLYFGKLSNWTTNQRSGLIFPRPHDQLEADPEPESHASEWWVQCSYYDTVRALLMDMYSLQCWKTTLEGWQLGIIRQLLMYYGWSEIFRTERSVRCNSLERTLGWPESVCHFVSVSVSQVMVQEQIYLYLGLKYNLQTIFFYNCKYLLLVYLFLLINNDQM